MPECPVTQFDFPIDLESSSVSGHDVRITVDEAVIDEDDGGKCLKWARYQCSFDAPVCVAKQHFHSGASKEH